MIDLSSIPSGKIALLFSGGPASTLLFWLLRDRELTLARISSVSQPTPSSQAVIDYVQARQGVEFETVELRWPGIERHQALAVYREQLRALSQWSALVCGYHPKPQYYDPARRAREQGHVDQEFFYLPSTGSELPRQGFLRPRDMQSIARIGDTWVYEPLADRDIGRIYQEYRALGLEELWALTHSCWDVSACSRCYDCRSRQWAEHYTG